MCNVQTGNVCLLLMADSPLRKTFNATLFESWAQHPYHLQLSFSH